MHPFKTYQEFFPFYLNEHSKLWTRIFHYVGTSIALACIVTFVMTFRPSYLVIGLVVAYGFAWFSHFTIEHNKPATFKYPLWSYIADHHMLGLAITGKLGPRLDAAKQQFQTAE